MCKKSVFTYNIHSPLLHTLLCCKQPAITKKLSEAGTVFTPQVVANAIVTGSTYKHYNISIGLDGWLLKNTQPGMSPITNIYELVEGVLMSGISRLIGACYLVYFDWVVRSLSKRGKD